ncbi:MAG: site-2 protease family protein [Anaerolineae bacterium]|nr:site-2 protease family protein [Anaerolineae bacterium]
MLGLTPNALLARLIVILLGIPIHEWAHGWVAHALGDETPELQGRLTLNPLTHLDPLGTLMILFTGFGWGRAARVNPYRMNKVKNPRVGMALSALAGPLSNIIQAMLFALPIRLGVLSLLPASQGDRLAQVLIAIITVNIGLAAFNLLPIPPLDGSKILAGILPSPLADVVESLEPYASYIFIFVLFILPRLGLDIVSAMVYPLQQFLIRMLFW